jgi:hypothetical protein
MIILKSFNTHLPLLPYDGSKIKFLAKNLKISSNDVFVILSIINITSDEFVPFLINERLKNRSRRTNITDGNSILV